MFGVRVRKLAKRVRCLHSHNDSPLHSAHRIGLVVQKNHSVIKSALANVHYLSQSGLE